MNSENSKTSEPHVLILKLTNKLDLRTGEKTIAISNLSIYYTWKIIKSSYNNNKFKISAPRWNDKFELPDGLYSVSDINRHFYINIFSVINFGIIYFAYAVSKWSTIFKYYFFTKIICINTFSSIIIS